MEVENLTRPHAQKNNYRKLMTTLVGRISLSKE